LETGKNLYEGMFLVDTALATSDWDGVLDMIKKILTKSGAEIVSIKKWDERKLAYEINKKSRGTYILCYFNVEGPKVSDIERDIRLSEKVMRVLILSTEPMSQEDIDRDTPLVAAEKRAAEAVVAAAEGVKPGADAEDEEVSFDVPVDALDDAVEDEDDIEDKD